VNGGLGGHGRLRPSFHLYLLVSTLIAFFAQIPLGVFAARSPLDATAHVLLPAAAASLLHDLLYSRVAHSAVQYFCTMVLLGVGAEMIWEVLEFTADAVLHIGWQVDNADTMYDIVCGIVGAVLGAGVRLWLWTRSRRVDAAEREDGERLRLYHRRCAGRDGSPTYEGLWVAGSVGRWCTDRHSSAAEAERCARGRWWHDRERARGSTAARPSGTPAVRRSLLRVPWAQTHPALRPACGLRPLHRVGLAGAATVIVLVPSGYVGLLAWAASPAPPHPSVPRTVSTAPAEPGAADPGQATIAEAVPVPSLGGSVPVGGTPGFVVVTPDGRHAYVAHRAAKMITVVDTAVNRVTAVVPMVQGPPQHLAFSPDGRTAYVAIWDDARTAAAIGVLDTTTNSVVATIPLRSGPFLAAVSPDGRQLWVPGHDAGTVSVFDAATWEVVAEIRVAPGPSSVEFSQDGRRAYTTSHGSRRVSVIDTATRTVVSEFLAPSSPNGTAVHPTRPLVASVDATSDSVTMTATDTERPVATVAVGRGPQDVAWAADGRFAYVANAEADTVSIIDAGSMAVVATVPTGTAPTSIAVLPSGQAAYVANLRDGTLTVLDTAH
jgi:YVTN family beta-propeller protein